MPSLLWWAASLLIALSHGHLRLNSIDAENSTTSRETLSAVLVSASKEKLKTASVHPDHSTPSSIQIHNVFGGMSSGRNTSFCSSRSKTLQSSIRVQRVPVKVWAFWFGNKGMDGHRKKAFEMLQRNIGAPVELVTDTNLHEYNIPESPMHPAVCSKTLSAIHKGDYLRVYFMHHYGGGYHDVKPHSASKNWTAWFSKFENPAVWLIGAPEISRGGVACDEGYVNDQWCTNLRKIQRAAANRSAHAACCAEVKKNFDKLVNSFGYIMRPRTALTRDWLEAVERTLDAKMDELKKHPAPYCRCSKTLAPCPNTTGYPIRWAELHSEAFHPLQFKYRTHILRTLPNWFYRGPEEHRGARR